MIKCSESNRKFPFACFRMFLFILSNTERSRCLCLSHSMVYNMVHLSRANWRASPTYTFRHSPTRRWFLGAFAAHTHERSADEDDTYTKYDSTNGGENVARATIRYAIFRMKLFKSIQNGQPNVAHAIYSLSL